MLEQKVGFAVSIAEHAQELYFDVVQGMAVGSEHQTVFAAEFAEGQAAADDFQTHAVFFQVDAAQMRIRLDSMLVDILPCCARKSNSPPVICQTGFPNNSFIVITRLF